MSNRSLESIAMRVARNLRMEKVRWSLRRLYVPVEQDALVLEVGSGGNPYPRSNVLLDAYEETRERHYAPLVHDRPTVLAFGENLPFKDKAFDFVIAAHVIEHTPDPEKFLAELQRVAHAGYIESPDAFMERINPYKDHRLEVTLRDNVLVIRKKNGWIVDENLIELYEHKAKHWVTQQLIPQHPSEFHVRYYWNDKINFSIVNPEVDASWESIVTDRPIGKVAGIRQVVRDRILRFFRWAFSQNKRNKSIDLLELFRCPQCHSEKLVRKENKVFCQCCESYYKEDKGVFTMQPCKLGEEK